MTTIVKLFVVSCIIAAQVSSMALCGVASVDECSVVQCVAAHSVMWQHSLIPRPCVLPTLIIGDGLGTRLVPALQKRHDVTCHWYRYLSHQADVTCRLLTLPTLTLCSICTCGTWKFTKMATSEIVCSFQCCIVKLLCHECSFLDTPLFIKAVDNTCPLV